MSPVFAITYTIWLLSEIILNRTLRSKSTDKQNADKNSLRIIWITVLLSNTLAMFISMNSHLPISVHPATPYVGLVIIFFGILLRLAAVVSLGRFFTVDVTIRADHKLKKDGLYKIFRHPSYFASLLSFMGFGISTNNWLSLLIILVATIAVFRLRIRIEEKTLITQFGQEYLDYKKSTWGMIPFLR